MKIVEYGLAIGSSPEELEKLVNGMMVEDWQPLGGASVTLSESDDFRYVEYAQAMVKYGPDYG